MSSEQHQQWFSAVELAAFGKPAGLPGTSRGCFKRAIRERWATKIVPGKGGRDGTLTLFSPPATVLAGIAVFKHSQISGDQPKVTAYVPEVSLSERRAPSAAEPVAAYSSAIDVALFSRCRTACQEVHGAEFVALPMDVQDQYAGDLYSVICRLAGILGRPLDDATKAESAALAGLLAAVHQMGWVRRFPDRRYSVRVQQVS